MSQITPRLPTSKPGTAWHPLEAVRREVERLYSDLSGVPWAAPGTFSSEPRWDALADRPRVDIVEKDCAYELTADLAGADEKDVEVTVTNDILRIKGARHDEREHAEGDYVLRERSYGSFERSFRLPADVDGTKVAAAFKKGVLSVTLPKTAAARSGAKKIEIKAS